MNLLAFLGVLASWRGNRFAPILRFVFVLLLLCPLSTVHCSLGWADQSFPAKDWKPKPDPIASPHAVAGGQIVVWAGDAPNSLNYYLDNNTVNSMLFGMLYETLLDMDAITYEFTPGLAAGWTISDDKLTFTFRVDDAARWSDGKPVTAHDVKWTYDAVVDTMNLTGPHKVALERFESPVVIDDRTIRFTAREVHWRNLLALASFHILPKHIFAEKDFNKINFEFPVVGGPYRLGEYKEGMFLTVERRKDWWRRKRLDYRGIANFQTIKLKFYAQEATAWEAFLKGEIDLYLVNQARIWVTETSGGPFEKNWIVKQKVYNYEPEGFQGFAMNQRRFPFDDVRVRQAMAMLVDRDKMNRTLMYSQYYLFSSYWPDLYSPEHPDPKKPAPFDKDAARKLLGEAGWKVNAKTGILEKDGRPFAFSFLERSESTRKFLVIYQQDLKDVGIDLKIEQKDWAAWIKDMDEFNYDMTWASWSASVFKDPEGMWHSKEAVRPSGNNVTGFQNKQVDAMIESMSGEFNLLKRHETVRKIDRIVFDAHPYALLWGANYNRIAYWNKFGTPPTVLSKYGDWQSSLMLWWFDEDIAADLDAAKQAGEPLPQKPVEVRFDEAVKVRGPGTGKD